LCKRIGIIGGGISGLSSAYFLLKQNYRVDIFESSDQLGGLASSFDFGNLVIEKYYHFICGGDEKLIEFASELGIDKKLRFRPTTTAFYYNGRYFPFGTPLNLLTFSPISFLSRIRFGFNIASSKTRKKWEQLDHISAKDWLIRAIGEKAYYVIWDPLLKVKFGEYYDQISASWIWHRIHRVAASRKGIFSKEKMGYFEGGSHTLIEAMSKKIQEMGGNIHLNCKAMRIEKNSYGIRVFFDSDQYEDFNRAVLAIPLPIASKITTHLDSKFSEQLSSIKFIGVVCGIFRLADKVSDAFWLNINDSRILSNGIIEYTNLNPLEKIKSDRIVYVPFYLPPGDRLFNEDRNTLKKEFFEILKIIRPELKADCLLDFCVFRSNYAQAICTTAFKEKIPPIKTPVDHLFLLDSTQIYPSDRSLDAMIDLAEHMVIKYF